MNRTLLTVALGVGCATAALRAAQFSYTTAVDVVAFTVTVVQRNGTTLRGLTAADFEIREDGALQTISNFSAGDDGPAIPLHLGLLFDTSESMDKDLSLSRGAAIRFLRAFPEAVDFTLVDFDTEVRAARFQQNEFARLVERIRNRPARGNTALYDAVSVYLGSAFDQTGRKVLVVYTDGGDTASSRSWTETLRILRASDVTLYAMGFTGHQRAERFQQERRLVDMATITGGLALFPNGIDDLDEMYGRISAEIHNQYVIGYVSTNTAKNGTWRKVAVRLKRPSQDRTQVRTREGYFAPSR